MFTKISHQYDDVTLSLSKRDTVWNHWNFIKRHNIKIPYITDTGERDFNKIFLIRIFIGWIAITIVIISTNILIHLFFSIIWTSIVFISILDSNFYIFLDAISTFDVYYKVINIAVGITCQVIVTHDTFDTQGSSLYLVLLILNHILGVLGNAGVVFLISLFDGFAMKYSLKLLFGIQAILLYCLQMTFLYLAKNAKHSEDNVLGIDADFRSIGISCIISTVIFIGKQFGTTGIFKVASSTIVCHIPVKIHKTIDNRTVTIDDTKSKSKDKLKGTAEMTELNVSLLKDNEKELAEFALALELENDHDTSITIEPSKHTMSLGDEHDDNDEEGLDIESVSNMSSSIAPNSSLRASEMIRAICEKLGYHIIIKSEITVFYAWFHFVFRLNHAKSVAIANYLGNKRVILTGVAIVLLWVIYLVISGIAAGGSTSYDLGQCIALMIAQVLFVIVLSIFIGNYSYQVFLYFIKSFTTWWILCDSLTMLTAEVLISMKQKEYEFAYDFKDYNIWMSYYIIVLEYIILGIMCPLGITIIQAIIGKYSNISRVWINLPVLAAIGFWFEWGIAYFLDDDVSYVIIFGHSIEYAISLNHFAFTKAMDLVIWFLLQLYRQNKHPKMIKWSKIKCAWTDSI